MRKIRRFLLYNTFQKRRSRSGIREITYGSDDYASHYGIRRAAVDPFESRERADRMSASPLSRNSERKRGLGSQPFGLTGQRQLLQAVQELLEARGRIVIMVGQDVNQVAIGGRMALL